VVELQRELDLPGREGAGSSAHQQRQRLRLCALKAWAIDKGISAYERAHSSLLPSDPVQAARAMRGGLATRQRARLRKTVFTKAFRRKACTHLDRAMVSYASLAQAAAFDLVGAGGGGGKRKLALQEAFDHAVDRADDGSGGVVGSGGVWAVLQEECVDVMQRFATDELRRWEKLDLADKDGLVLSRVLLLISRLGLDDYHDHILLSIPRLGGQYSPQTSTGPTEATMVTGWHVPLVLPPRGWCPPRVLGYNAFAALHRSMTCARNGLRLGKAAHLLTHLHLHVRWKVGDDAWLCLQEAVTETCVALSWFPAPGGQESGVHARANTQHGVAHVMVLWLPWFLAAPLAGQHRTRPANMEPDAAPVLRSALQLIPLLLRRCFELQAAASAEEAEAEGGGGGGTRRSSTVSGVAVYG